MLIMGLWAGSISQWVSAMAAEICRMREKVVAAFIDFTDRR